MKKFVVWIIAVTLLFAVLNVNVSTKQGVNNKVRIYKIPLYIKIVEFLNRDYRYKILAREIAGGIRGEKEKALAIFDWVQKNIRTDMPEDWPIYDDHILNIIIRGYGVSDQLNDVFTTLCMYSHLQAGWIRIEVSGGKKELVLSFVKIKGKWRIFDAYRGVYFKNPDGDIASVSDILAGRYDKDAASKPAGSDNIVYEDYFKNLGGYMKDVTLRARKQMPVHRAMYEMTKFWDRDE